MKRKRTTRQGLMVAWSNGRQVHVVPSELKTLRDEYQRRLDKNSMVEFKLYSCHEVDKLALNRSRILEEYSNLLWNLDQRKASFRCLMAAANETIDNTSADFDPDEVSYNHPNLVEFRHLVYRCMSRVHEDPSLKSIFQGSKVFFDYKYMIDIYTRYF